MTKRMKSLFASFISLGVIALFAGCNTMEGAGEAVEEIGEGIGEDAEAAQEALQD